MYFDAFLIGLTATPAGKTIGFFNQNMVMQYGHEEAVTDGVNVDFDVYRIRTRVTEGGAAIVAAPTGVYVDKRNKLTRKERIGQLQRDLTYTADQLDRIAEHVATSLAIEEADFETGGFGQQGSLGRAHAVFGDQLRSLLQEHNATLAA